MGGSMKKRSPAKLSLHRVTLKELTTGEAAQVGGGAFMTRWLSVCTYTGEPAGCTVTEYASLCVPCG